jgi:hypothetical protein
VPSYIAELLGVQDFFFQMPESERVFGSWNREPNLSGFVNWASIYFFVQLFSFSSHVCQYKYPLLSFMHTGCQNSVLQQLYSSIGIHFLLVKEI